LQNSCVYCSVILLRDGWLVGIACLLVGELVCGSRNLYY
jgi:hypothetical protein